MKEVLDKARVLAEALPYIRQFYARTIVIKYGGASMLDEALKASFASDVVLMRYIGLRPVIVHGGGPQIGELLRRLGKASAFVDGMRVTDAETMEVVEMVLGGRVNAEIVSLIGQAGGRAVGLSGKDCDLIRAGRLLGTNGEDLGLVGTPEHVDPSVVVTLVQSGFVPVIAPIASGSDGRTYNLNADVAAGRIAEALEAEKLILLTDVEGVLDGDGKLVPRLTASEARALLGEGAVSGGMIPKLRHCIEAVEAGVRSAHVIDGRLPHALLLEIFTDRGVGTVVRAG